MKVVCISVLSVNMFFTISEKLFSQEIPNEIYTAIKTGDSKRLVKHFNNCIYLVIPGAEGVYTRTQSALILQDFFTHNIPDNYAKLRESGKGVSRCVIGILNTSKGNIVLFLFIKTLGRSL